MTIVPPPVPLGRRKRPKKVETDTVRCLPNVKWQVSLGWDMPEAPEALGTPTVARELTAFQQYILVVLAEEDRYGLAIKRELEAYYDDEVNHGRLYPNLDELVEMGLVEKSQLDKRTNQYSLTEDGREAILEQLRWVLGNYVNSDERADELRSLIEASR
jgi:DNA-binding PadR family transcriptional regulator